MSIPEVLSIRREPELRTATIGRHDGGQFFGYGTGARHDDRFFAVLHLFDHDGRHLRTRVWPLREDTGGGDPGIDRVLKELDSWLAALPGREYGDIAVRLFEETIDGVFFGLVAESHRDASDGECQDGSDGEREDDWIELYPGGLGFHAPWDGSYDA
jgi:hypothetical protein